MTKTATTKPATVTLTDAERLLTPEQAVAMLPQSKLVAYMEAFARASKAPAKEAAPRVTLGEYKGNVMIELREPGARPLNLSLRKTLRILKRVALIQEACVEAVKAKDEKVISLLKDSGLLKKN